MTLEKFEVMSRRTNKVQFTAEIDVTENMLPRVKLGLAVRWARKNYAVLSDADLSGAVLRGADLRGADLRGAVLRGADLRGADLSDAVLSGAVLRGADLRGADLRGAVLSDADLRGAVLNDCPVKIENIHQQVYAAASKESALDMRAWHADGYCGTTHCRAGWVTHLAGEGGRALEFAMGTPAAASMIYLASDPNIEKMPNFYASNATALEDMKACAEREAGDAK